MSRGFSQQKGEDYDETLAPVIEGNSSNIYEDNKNNHDSYIV